MNNEKQFESSPPEYEIQKPPRFMDFVKPNPFVKHWMLPYLPKNVFLRDSLVMGVGCAIGVLLAIIFGKLAEPYGIYVGGAIALVFIVVFQGDLRSRYLEAGMKLRQERKNGRTPQSE